MLVILAQAIYMMSRIFYLLILIRCIISWLPINRNNSLVRLCYMLTEPVLAPIRRLFDRSPIGGAGIGIDFSPVIAIILVDIVCRLLISVLYRYGI